MKFKNIYKRSIKGLILGSLILTSIHSPLQAQEAEYTKPSWWFGAAAGANLNYYRGTTQELNSELVIPAAFHHGFGAGLYMAPLVEYYKPDTRLGAMLQIGYDNRKGTFDQVITPCNCPADLSANLSFITIEPSLRLAPFKSGFYVYFGPRLAFNVAKSFSYQLGTNPELTAQTAEAEVKGDFDKMNKVQLSMQVGAGYDIPVSSQRNKTQFVLSPFVSFQPYFGQDPRSIETWNVTTLRIGASLKFGRGRKITPPASTNTESILVEPEIQFSVNAPKNIPVERRVRETFPIRNYVFFDKESTDIPDRYVLLSKDQVKDFKEDQLEVFAPKRLSGRSAREMVVYYNVLNILGDRMQKNPSANIKLVGSSEKGPADGNMMAMSVKNYLVEIFGINPSRIGTEGNSKPAIPSEQPGATLELELLREGDRRVSIESTSPALLMEFQSGPDAPLKPVEFYAVQEAPLDSYVSFYVTDKKETLSSWSLEIRNEKGEVQNFGPFTKEKISIPGKSILGARPSGDYKVTMVGKLKDGNTIKKEATVHMVLWKPSEREEGMRYSVIFEFNESKAISIYQKYLAEIVTPKIPKNGTVIIHGHSDIIGDENYNLKLSTDRAMEVRSILEKSLAKANRSDVTFEVYGFGEDESQSPFENKFPEERFYNRTVIIDIIPAK